MFGQDNLHIQFFYFPVIPKPCYSGCYCYYSPTQKVNIFDCNNKNLTSLPDRALKNTDWLQAKGNKLGNIDKVKKYMEDITFFDLRFNEINTITDDVMKSMLKNSKYFTISNNNIKILPRAVTTAKNNTELYISGNPYECNCNMMWMRDWLVRTTNVRDKRNVTCATGKSIGNTVHSLSFL